MKIELYDEILEFNDKDSLLEYLHDRGLRLNESDEIVKMENVGCIPDVLSIWFDKRVEYNDLKKKYGKSGDKEKYAFYHKRQLVQKILLNSLYGVLGLPAFRFYDLDNAEAVTTTGQTVIKSTAEMVNIKYNKELNTKDVDHNIYIDTDSVFFSAVPIMDNRYDNWQNEPQEVIAQHVDTVAGEVQDYLNQFYDILAKRMFNIDKHRLQIKKEYVIKAGLWVKKKRYAQWIIADNGVSCDMLDVKGLDVKRSSFPYEFQVMMKQVLIDILKGEKEDDITNKLNEFKANIADLEIQNIAKNSAVKDIQKYTEKNRSAILQFKKGTPAHVKAALAYNDLLTHFKSAYKYQPMKGGDKIKWVYLKTNPLGIDGLGFTGYSDPKEITDFIEMYIDRDRIFEAELHFKLQAFYDAVGWGNILSQKKKASQFFNFG